MPVLPEERGPYAAATCAPAAATHQLRPAMTLGEGRLADLLLLVVHLTMQVKLKVKAGAASGGKSQHCGLAGPAAALPCFESRPPPLSVYGAHTGLPACAAIDPGEEMGGVRPTPCRCSV